MKILNVAALYVIVAVSLNAAVIHIPKEYPTIQQGIDSSLSGDTVIVQPGIYKENIRIENQEVIIGSLFLTTGNTAHISTTIIDGDSSGPVVVFEHCEGTSTLAGFTIRNGYDSLYGGGIRCLRSSPIIRNNVITGNRSGLCGAGICLLEGSGGTIINNTITGNQAGSYAGGINTKHSNPTITNCILWDNSHLQMEICGTVAPAVTFCDIQGGWKGEGNIGHDPIFCDSHNFDFHLSEGSPCAAGGRDGGVIGALGVACPATDTLSGIR